ncbi:MAG: sulfite exporter TauE/SafE family protein [Candidatus Taylorbacteria bacterium]|nr:sulfite exporter TauE/SafE family protein [Candidatus Taylorbacteria bacterium]
MDTYRFHVNGMHCKSCSVLIEDELKSVPGVGSLSSDFRTKELVVSGSFDVAPHELAKLFTEKVKAHGYTVSVDKSVRQAANWGEFKIAVPIALAFMAGFVILQKLGLVNAIGSGEVTLGTTFLVGLIASVSTCMAVVGGLLLSMSASYAKGGHTVGPQLMFHIGRLAGFFILGGVIGALGSAFQIAPIAHVIIGFIISFIMVILGINLMDIFPLAERLQLTLPAGISKRLVDHAKGTDVFAPVLLGVATFFLPCGFTQSMQLYALTTGNFVSGALIMLVFALGTLPVLSILSFSSVRINQSRHAGTFFKTVGVIVIAFAIYNFLNTLVIAGLIAPIFSF